MRLLSYSALIERSNALLAHPEHDYRVRDEIAAIDDLLHELDQSPVTAIALHEELAQDFPTEEIDEDLVDEIYEAQMETYDAVHGISRGAA